MGSLYFRQFHIGFMPHEKEVIERFERAGERLNIKNKTELFKQMLLLGLSTYEKSNSDVFEIRESLQRILQPNNQEIKDSSEKIVETESAKGLTESEMKEFMELKKKENGLQERLYGDVLLIKSMLSSIFELLNLKTEDPNFTDGTEIIPYLYKIGGYSKTPDYLKELEQEFSKRDE